MAFERLIVFLQDAATLTGIDTVVEKVSSPEFRNSVKKTVTNAYEKERERQGKFINSKDEQYKEKLANASTEQLRKMREATDSDWIKNAIDDELSRR